MEQLNTKDIIIVIALVLGLVISTAYTFIVWPKIDKRIKRHLEKKYGVKFVHGETYIDPQDGRLIGTLEVKGGGDKSLKRLLKNRYYLFSFLAAFWPLLLYAFLLLYFKEDLKLLNARF